MTLHRLLVALAAVYIVCGSLAAFWGLTDRAPSFRRFSAPPGQAAPLLDTGAS